MLTGIPEAGNPSGWHRDAEKASLFLQRDCFEGVNMMTENDIRLSKVKVKVPKVKVTVVMEAQFRLGVATEQSQCIFCGHMTIFY